MTDIILTEQQSAALKAVQEWMADPERKQVLYLGGYAGTGKTTIAKQLVEGVKGSICACAFTGKAALVMRKAGFSGASTIHSLIYTPTRDEFGHTKFVLDEMSAASDAALIVLDECSMVGEELGRDLLSFGTPILVIGDPAQLPPVRGAGFFTSREPDVLLTEIHRQAEGNPIIDLASRVRHGESIGRERSDECVVTTRKDCTTRRLMKADQILVGLNRTRNTINKTIRKAMGFDPNTVEPGDRLICERNDHSRGLLNGMQFEVLGVRPDENDPGRLEMTLQPLDTDGDSLKVDTRLEYLFQGKDAWRDLAPEQRRGCASFSFAYAITVHKSQGSQWPSVALVDESGAFRADGQKWLYTGVTRAAEMLTVYTGRAA